MSAAIRRAWRKPPQEMPFKQLMAALRQAGCACKGTGISVRIGDGPVLPMLPKIESSFWATLGARPNTPGGGRPPRTTEHHRCTGCDARIDVRNGRVHQWPPPAERQRERTS